MAKLTVGGVVFGEGRPKIIVPIVGKNEQEILEAASDIKTIDCDLVEWRIDFFDKVEEQGEVSELSKKIRKIINRPLLVTFRTKKEGGVLELSDNKYFEVYNEVVENGNIDLLDVELFMPVEEVSALIEKAHANNVKIVMCNHDFDKTPERDEIVNRLTTMSEKGADICKIAVMPNSNKDVITLLDATRIAKEKINKPLITMSMGALGMTSRVSGEVFGSTATFGAAKQSSAPGQVPVAQLREILDTLKLN
ncbi:3-dehydroquinate dehydratase, type I [Gemella bergeri ATCC 700627]|uniref:3-dehydroquinate dehydratase n=1 Tax=Gemella bergeri ATCC 700627 TaxID=1321820 RepID=U2QK76_9BACL|nr:type I 3-dehydroquinate dehydratase [Gemella bergeri]ERK56886.1 3-dehydroquinate dehydratase, type I [Gemella bergeri ATCC 700627]